MAKPKSLPQAVLSPLTASAVFLVLRVEPGGEQAARALLGDIVDLRKSVGFRVQAAHLSVVVGIGSAAWDRLYSGPRPRHLHPFRELRGDRHYAPATEGDLLFHIRATEQGVCYELARLIMKRLAGAATVVDEVHGFRYFDNRDLLGFVDGTANPDGEEAVETVAISADDDADFAGGSYVIVQKYLHDLDSWDALPVPEQERVIGRTKLEDVELSDDVKPANSHVALSTIEDPDGNELQIHRDNMPFYNFATGTFGTYFIGYAADPGVIEQMLRNMFCGRAPATHDRILDFSTAVTGVLFFVPTLEILESLAAAENSSTASEPAMQAPRAATQPDPPKDGSLNIGSMKPNPNDRGNQR
jgi:putative iron-dependent peroxidase